MDKVIIDGTEYKLKELPSYEIGGYHNPVISFRGKNYVAKAIKKEVDTFWYVEKKYGGYVIHKHTEDSAPFDKKGYPERTFTTEEMAKEYVLFNSKLLSLNDLLSVWGEGDKYATNYQNAPLFLKFKELAKKKMNL